MGNTRSSWPAKMMLTALVTASLTGCVTVPSDSGSNPQDPLETMNRNIFAFNQQFDAYIAKPVAQTYVNITPSIVRQGIQNSLNNIYEPSYGFNNALQGNVNDSITSVFRFLVNTTFGVFGIFDVASWIGLESKPQDFGVTLARWGVPAGPYLMLPFLGPSTLRDSTHYIEEIGTSPLTYIFWSHDPFVSVGVDLMDGVNTRANLLQLDTLRANTIDEYIAIRDAYLASRKAKINEGEHYSAEKELEELTPLDLGDE